MNGIPEIIKTVHDLRRRWKPHKERLAALKGEQPTSIRFHRACSWMARVEQMPDGQDHDFGLISLWIAFNALYGQWDCQNGSRDPTAKVGGLYRSDSQARPRRPCSGGTTRAQAAGDGPVRGRISSAPISGRSRPPSGPQPRKAAHNAQTWYIEKRWTRFSTRSWPASTSCVASSSTVRQPTAAS